MTTRTQELGPEMMERKVQPRICDQSLKNAIQSNVEKHGVKKKQKTIFGAGNVYWKPG